MDSFSTWIDRAGASNPERTESVLERTDHWIALGNIASARGRIVRRQGDYQQAIRYFNQAACLYERRSPDHSNLARAVVNLAFVKRLLALQFERHIDFCTSKRDAGGGEARPAGQRLRPLHRQYRELYEGAIAELERAKRIYILHGHTSGLASALLNGGYLHPDGGNLDLATREATEAYAIAERTNITVLKARSRTLSGWIENARVEGLFEQPEDVPEYAPGKAMLPGRASARGEHAEQTASAERAYRAG